MEYFIGTKIIHAALAQPVQGREPGYDVIYPDTGYRSWSPKDTFEKHYRRTGEMTFGQAMEAARMGEKVRRAGWSDTTYVFAETYPDDRVPSMAFMQRVLWEPRAAVYEYAPSQHDMITDDWQIMTPGDNRAMELQGSSLR